MKPLIIANYGRCGKNLLRRMIQDNYEHKQYSDMRIAFQDNSLYLTHDYCKEVKGIKAIFIYGHPVNTIISTNSERMSYPKEHYAKFGADYNNNDWINKDVLDLEGHFDSWYKKHTFPILLVKYETLYDHLLDISGFIDNPLTFIPRKERVTDYNTHLEKDRLFETYKSIIKKYEAASECRVIK